MSNKLRKRITCCLCGETVKLTDKCVELFGKDVCPDCAVKVTKIVNDILDDKFEENKEE